MYNLLELSKEEVSELNKQRAESLLRQTNGMLNEPSECYLPFINDLRFNHGYIFLRPFLIQGQTGLKLELKEYPNEKRLHLAYIGVLEEYRQQGHGNEIMKIMTDIADRYGYLIDLEIQAKFGVTKTVLKKFYKKHGFVKKGDEYVREAQSKL
jgi:ribosomal protein S18 acetylase RimI-like enzyme